MAPISDKRQRNDQNQLEETHVPSYGQIRIHKVTHNSNYAAKENSISPSASGGGGGGGKHMKRGLEILDFHESWLEEMEIYKDQINQHQSHKKLYGKSDNEKGYNLVQSNRHEMQSLQELFLRQQKAQQLPQQVIIANELHKGHSHHYSVANAANINIIEQNSMVPLSENTERAFSRKSSPRRHHANGAGPKRRSPEAQASKILTKNAVRSGQTIAEGYGNNLFNDDKYITLPASDLQKSQLLLKRPREETNMTVSTNNKTVPVTVNLSMVPTTTTTTTTSTNTITTTTTIHNNLNNSSSNNNKSQGSKRHTRGDHHASGSLSADTTNNNNNNNNNNNKEPSSGIVNGAKVIINQFHASSLLNSFHYEEKTKILTQNGLNKSAANAYEASFYANHYLATSDQNTGSNYYGTRHYGDYNYSGVALANGDHANKRGAGGHTDDPCGAIDEVTYTDSESETDEYVGLPLHLKEDGADTCQSHNIRHGPFFEDLNSQKSNKSSSTTVSPSEKTKADTEDSSTIKSEQSVYYTPINILTPSLFPNVPPYLNFSSHAEKGPHMPATLHKVLKWKLSPVMPRIVRRVVLNSGFRIIKNTTDWMAVWEKHMKSPGFRTIRSHQKYNHMPGSFRIGRKDSMWRCIHHNMQKHGNKEFGFMQKSYIMPDDLEALRTSWPRNASKLTKWIVKPPASARGTGIRIVNKWSQFPKDRPLVVQKYIERPLLINDNKFDMRIYVVVTSINPLRIYMYKDGLARFASVKYSSELNHLDDRCMHLTNYSINKLSQNYSKNEDVNACQGHKWSLQSLWSCLEGRGINTKRLWATLRNLVIRAIVSGESGLNRMYRQNVNFRYNCFELFGFDVLLDENLIPWLLEINISPSLHSELPLDLHVKGPLIQATLNTALYQVPPKLTERQQQDIMAELKIKRGPLCLDKRIYTTCLTAEEVRKHNHFTNRSIEFREEYLETILENLLPDDVRCLIIAEDELARCSPMERIFPTADTYDYLKFMENSRYYNRLLDAWENRYAHCRDVGIDLLKDLCEAKYHLQVADAALEKEPEITLTDIDMLHTKKAENDVVTNTDNGGSRNLPQTSQLATVEEVVAAVTKTPADLKVKDSSMFNVKASVKPVKAN